MHASRLVPSNTDLKEERAMRATLVLFSLATALAMAAPSFADTPASLTVEAKIPLGAIKGRIDHLALDSARKRLFVAELGNNSVGVIDIEKRQDIRTLTGLNEPQGIGYVAATDTLYVANAGDGSVRLFAGADLAPAGRIELGSDADNVRVIPANNRVIVGFGSGGLAIIDAATHQKIGDIPLPAHPESFQIDAAGTRAFVNLPDRHALAVVDLAAGKLTATLPLTVKGNFPMALDPQRDTVLIVSRDPAKLLVFGFSDHALRESLSTCGDADDVFLDAKRARIYISCGEGSVDVFAARNGSYAHLGRLSTVAGARTSFFDPQSDRLFLAVRAAAGEPAAIWVLRPDP
jgi:DNA-binding beta-propeller fold protein YncE